jgi:polysaccharide chain length determinant protein (PEP-CTERM system associated)
MQETINFILLEIRSALRFRWYGMALAWTLGLAGGAWILAQPDTYEGSARVFVDTTSALEPFLENQIVVPDVEVRLAYVREALTGTEQLATVARTVGLDAEAETETEREGIRAALREAIQIETVGASFQRPDNIYRISYLHPKRDVAVGVVATLIETLEEGVAGENQRGGDTAAEFLDQRVREYETRLQEAEAALADFKKQHADSLPGAEGDYFARMQLERTALAEANRELRILVARRDQLIAQLNGEPTAASAVVAGIEPPPNSLDARIRQHRADLDALLLNYTERHPDVIAMKDSLDSLLAQREEQLASVGLDGADRELISLTDNPVEQALRIALNEAEGEIAALRADVQERNQNMRELQALINEVPQVEAELARLNRDYEVVSEQYTELVRSRETQELTRKAADTDQIDIRTIDPPSAGAAPVGPRRPLYLAALLVGALGAGGLLCYVLAQMLPVFGTTRRLGEVVGLPVLGAVSHAWKERRHEAIRRSTYAYAVATAGLILLIGVFVGFDVAGFRLAGQIGG